MANVKYLIALLSLTACGGAFTSAIPNDAGDGGESEIAHNEAGRDAIPPEEAGLPEAIAPETAPPPQDAGHEAMPPVDSSVETGHEAAPPPDSGHDSGPCLPPSSYDYKIFSGGSTFVGYTTPVECQCAATYTCACLLSAPDICTATFGSPTGCTTGTVLTVDCSP